MDQVREHSASEKLPTRSAEPTALSPSSKIAIELGLLALAMGEELSTERQVLMADDLADLDAAHVIGAIRCWRKGTLKLRNPEDMRRFPTAYQLRAWITRPRLRYLNRPQEPVNPE